VWEAALGILHAVLRVRQRRELCFRVIIAEFLELVEMTIERLELALQETSEDALRAKLGSSE